MKFKITFITLFCLSLSAIAKQNIKPNEKAWKLEAFQRLAGANPRKTLLLAEHLFSDERMTRALHDPSRVFDWQHRIAALEVISAYFDPKYENILPAKFKLRAQALIKKALHKDPALVVRDQAVETIKMILRMRPAERKFWKKELEVAFFSEQNYRDQESFFIRETILSAFKEHELSVSKKMKLSIKADRNPRVKGIL